MFWLICILASWLGATTGAYLGYRHSEAYKSYPEIAWIIALAWPYTIPKLFMARWHNK